MSDVTRIIIEQAQEAMLRVLRDSTVTHMNAGMCIDLGARGITLNVSH